MIATAISVLFGVAAGLAIWSILDSVFRALDHRRIIKRKLAELARK